MGLNSTPSAERVHIGIFGKRNAGKSSVINAITGQSLAIVSDIKGTTTDPVSKAMELLPLGPVIIIDTPGLDDVGELGKMRVQKSYQVLNKTDIGVLVVDGTLGTTPEDDALISRFKEKNIPYIVVMNKLDLMKENSFHINGSTYDLSNTIWVSSTTNENIHELKEMIAKQAITDEPKYKIVADLLNPSDFVVLVVPIDKAAPKGRLILPQQQTIRDILEANATAIVVKECELKETLQSLGKKPKLVITDSQVFAKVSAETPKDILLTSFSILFARYKGDLEETIKGVRALESLKNNDTVLISEGCTHHRQCDDIGKVKIPNWVMQYTNNHLNFEFTSGTEFPCDLSKYKMIIHCGGCTLNEREMKYRVKCAKDHNIPITNYGILISYIQGILKRTVEPFPHISHLLEEE
ncbi:[FeFe] hydrogenase H-cluster maturation GTPase HydF [Terrisporobacter petrolearius]|uniref:[FeFe] hydrogenase H-cluster maturation GTPase HydF n=1 Tax=Terrisporobacter petrolearius TaxID=1460447 RepID=UPI001D162C72|nr:[FeFe] hydrogenase H-cluster maturation GTPase HydF [Terrisporobacter petrolearius]MCC3866342.1 [FeFe] hydrogenase H-cluster maturation GTPase HydF [Terrisporobacter petrolearius]